MGLKVQLWTWARSTVATVRAPGHMGAQCTHIAMVENPCGLDHACFRSLGRRKSRQLSAALPAIAREDPLGLAKLLKTKDQELAERVGFVPDELAPLNDSGRIGTARNRPIH
jgi:hypothetical protein